MSIIDGNVGDEILSRGVVVSILLELSRKSGIVTQEQPKGE
jgi:hypothetical protein